MVALQIERGKLLQHQDGDGGGRGEAKKMKKLGSMDTIKQRHAELPPETTPNYMKPTACSDARKVSTRSTDSNCTRDGSNLRRNGTKRPTSSGSSNWVAKNPKFKTPVAKTCSPVILWEIVDARRATCSSTLKDRKFPAYLELNHGGNESEGTSAIRVCPYTYCSLNGLHHAPIPPLKCFLSAKRANMRINLGCGLKTAGDGLNFDRKVGVEDDLGSLRNGVNEKEDRDWFVEILSDERDEMAKPEDRRERIQEVVLQAPIDDDVCVGESEENGSEANLVDGGFELDSGGSIVGLEAGNGAALFLGYNYESPPSEIEIDYDGKSEKQIGHHEVVLESTHKGDYIGEFSVNEAFQESNAQGFNSDGESSGSVVNEALQELNDQGFDTDGEYSGFVQSWVLMECPVSVENDQGFDSDGKSGDSVQSLVTIEGSASVEFPMEEPELVFDDMDQTLFKSNRNSDSNLPVSHNVAERETSFDNLENNLVEGFSCHTESSHGDEAKNVENQDNPAENIEISTILLPAKQCVDHRAGNAEDMITAFSGAKRKKAMLEDDELEKEFIKAFNRVKRKKTMQQSDELGTFNPREPNFLPLEPDPEAEKVDLRHQELNERRNTEEWMVDYALRQEVTKLGSARKRKVAILVEAFEKVLPVTRCELLLGSASSAFDLAVPIQACR